MRVLSWNINGIRATNKTSSMKTLLDSLEADIICLQETKITRSLLPEDIANVDGYLAFFSFSRKKGGYSGVVTYCKKSSCPIAAEEGLSGILTKDDNEYRIGHHVTNGFSNEAILSLDGEGRALLTEHKIEDKKHICIANVYCPRADVENKERYLYKMNFYRLLEARCKSLIKAGKHVIIVGDLNVSHKRIDHCDPDEDFEKNVARNWLNGLLGTVATEQDNGEVQQNNLEDDDNNADGINSDLKTGTFVDVFRMFYPTEKNAFTCWNTMTRARETNYGTRIDYILANCKLSTCFTDCRIRPDIVGSDHCPVQCDINAIVISSKIVPDLCAIFMPELSGKQVGITSYFSKKQSGCGDISIPQKRANDFAQNNSSKSRKISDNKESNNSMFKYFKSKSKCKTVKPPQEEECKKNTKDLITSEEIWISANYVSKTESKSKNSIAKASWKSILKGPEPTPLCNGHKEKSVLRTVKKEGPNLGRQFYACNRPVGHSSNKEASCEFFQWKQ